MHIVSLKMYKPPRKRYVAAVLLILLAIASASTLLNREQEQPSAPEPFVRPAEAPAAPTSQAGNWGSTNHQFRRKLQLTSQQKYAILTFDHKKLISQKLSSSSGSDLTIVAHIGSSAFPLPQKLEGAGKDNARLTFSTPAGTGAEFYFYYGGLNAKVTNEKLKDTPTAESTSATTGEEESLDLRVSSARFWALKYKTGVQLSLKLGGTRIPDENSPIYYQVNDAGNLRLIPDSSRKDGEVVANIAELRPGDQRVALLFLDRDGQWVRSNNATVRVSYPVFVAWTIDWEGLGQERDSVLAELNSIANSFKIPMTHFFNPRIYVSSLYGTYRTQELTNWVKSRNKLYYDEIGLHMHMFYDLVEAAGVTAKASPRWDNRPLQGYDVLTSDYNYAEFTKILNWALIQFEEHGLPRPLGFRAGGWFADLENLQALNDLGFEYDSSGRNTFKFPPRNEEVPWHLTAETQPSQISTTNQNSNLPLPTMELWEMPNNGNDTYWYPVEDLISRFFANYGGKGKVLSTGPKLVNYMSHPDWFDVDSPKLNKLFPEIAKYSYAADRGPVVFSTLGTALEEWRR